MQTEQYQLPLEQLRLVIDDIIDGFNNGAEFNQDKKTQLLLLSAKLDAFIVSLYSINY